MGNSAGIEGMTAAVAAHMAMQQDLTGVLPCCFEGMDEQWPISIICMSWSMVAAEATALADSPDANSTAIARMNAKRGPTPITARYARISRSAEHLPAMSVPGGSPVAPAEHVD